MEVSKWLSHNWRSHDHKAQHIRLTVPCLQSPTYHTDRRTTTKPNISDWQMYDHKAQHIKLTVLWPQRPTYQTIRCTTTKPNISDWWSYDHKAQHIRLIDVRPQSPTYQGITLIPTLQLQVAMYGILKCKWSWGRGMLCSYKCLRDLPLLT